MGETTANFRAGVPGKVHVYVSEAQFEQARELFETKERLAVDEPHEDEPSALRKIAWIALVLLVLFLMLLIGVG